MSPGPSLLCQQRSRVSDEISSEAKFSRADLTDSLLLKPSKDIPSVSAGPGLHLALENQRFIVFSKKVSLFRMTVVRYCVLMEYYLCLEASCRFCLG